MIVLPRTKLFSFLFSLNLLASCSLIDPEEETPSYIKITQYNFSTFYPIEGSNSTKINDVWIYIDDNPLGVFEIPITFPVLAEGFPNIKIVPGIKLSGFEARRDYFPFYEEYTTNSIELKRGEIVEIIPSFKYSATTKFAWKEDFETNQGDFEKTNISLIDLTKTDNAYEGIFSGQMELSAEKNFGQLISKSKLNLPKNGNPVFLEIDFYCDIPFEIYLQSNNIDGSVITNFVLGLNPTDGIWKKVYVELVEEVSTNTLAENYQIIFQSTLASNKTEGTVIFDNLKVIHF